MTKGEVTLHLASLSDAENYGVAALLLSWGREEGAIPSECDLEGDEEAVFAMIEHPTLGRTLVGGAVFYQPEEQDVFWIDVVFVSPQFRRKGIASAMIEVIGRTARDRNLSSIEFGAMLSNKAMQALAQKCAFDEGIVYFSRDVAPGGLEQ